MTIAPLSKHDGTLEHQHYDEQLFSGENKANLKIIETISLYVSLGRLGYCFDRERRLSR